MNETQETQDTEPVPVKVHGSIKVAVREYEIVGHGYTIEPGQAGLPFQLLPEDPTRVRAVLSSNQVFFIGDKMQLMSVTSIASTGTDGPGGRIPTGAAFLEVKAHNEIWAVSNAASCSVGVWVERRIPRN